MIRLSEIDVYNGAIKERNPMIQIFNSIINDSMNLLIGNQKDEKVTKFRQLPVREGLQTKQTSDMILTSDMAYELGGGNLPALSSILFTSDFIREVCDVTYKDTITASMCEEQDGIYLNGQDLSEINENVPYARLTIIGMESSAMEANQAGYDLMKQIEYTRYRTNISGFMMRISTTQEREMVRVSKNTLLENLDFSKVGSTLIKGYKKYAGVKWVKIYFITDKEFDYNAFQHQVKLSNGVIGSLNQIFANLQMDCGSCGLKQVCDEVEGLRELHFANQVK